MMLLALFHWAPSGRRDSILANGLVPGSPNTVCTAPSRVICLSPDPLTAWELSGAMEWVGHVDVWDLWRVEVADGDEVAIQHAYGSGIHEVRVSTVIPPSRVWFVGHRPAGVG